MKKTLEISTGTVGGALLVLIASMLLGEKAPWIFDKLTASTQGVYSLSLNADDIFDEDSEWQDLDPKRYHIDAAHKFYLRFPSRDWSVSVQDPGKFLTGLSIADIPFMRNSMSAFSTMMGQPELRKGDITTTSLTPPAPTRLISFTEESKFAGIPFRVNPFDDREFTKSSFRAGSMLVGLDPEEVNEILAEETDEAREMFKGIWDAMRAEGEAIIIRDWPSDTEIQPGITVTTFRRQILSASPIARVVEQGGRLSLYSALGFLQMMNLELMSVNIKNVDVSENNKAFLFDATAQLENIIVDGKETDQVEFVQVFLIAAEKDMIYVVGLKYLHAAGTTRKLQNEMEEAFSSFRILL